MEPTIAQYTNMVWVGSIGSAKSRRVRLRSFSGCFPSFHSQRFRF